MKTQQEIEEAAKSYGQKFYKSSHPDAMIEVYQNFTSGAKWMQKDLLESAPRDFNEYINMRNKLTDSLWEYNPPLHAWKVCELKNQKTIQDKSEYIFQLKKSHKEKDQKITELEKKLKEIRSIVSRYFEAEDMGAVNTVNKELAEFINATE